MNFMGEYEFANFGATPADVVDYSGMKNIFNTVTVNWSEPIDWQNMATRPDWPKGSKTKQKGLYAILRDHGRQKQNNEIQYIGMAKNIYDRLYTPTHPTVRGLVKKGGPTRISYGLIVGSGRHTASKVSELEDIFIWSHWPTIENKSGLATLPSMRTSAGRSKKRTRPWIITNSGYGFEGQMPKTIIYPWIAVSKAKMED